VWKLFSIRLYSHLDCRRFLCDLCYLYLFSHTYVQHDFHITWCSCCLQDTGREPLSEQELLTLWSTTVQPQFFSVVRVPQSADFCVVVCRSLFVCLSFTLPLYVCFSSVCSLRLPLWYLQTFSYYSWHDMTIGKTFDIFTYKWHLLYDMNMCIIPVHRSRFFHMFPFTIIIKLIMYIKK